MSVTQRPAVRVVRDRTIRVKVIDECGLACTFCHNEGTPVTADNRGRTLLPFLCVPVAELPKSGIVEEVKAFKDAEVRRLTSQYGAAA